VSAGGDGAALEIEHLYVAFGQQLVLEDVTLTVQRGEFVGVLGPNGSGKTTLLRAVLGLVKPTSGRIRVLGHEGGGGLAGRIGYVPQAAEIDPRFPVHVLDVVLMGRYGKLGLLRRPGPADREAAWRALELTGMQHLAGKQVGRLSGGERQRALVARALAAEPELLLLDEPTTAIDVAMTASLYELLHDLHHRLGLTVLIVSHDVGVVSQYVDAVACLSRRLVAHGRPDEVLSAETLEGMYGCGVMFFSHGEVPHMVVRRAEPGAQQ